MCEHDGGPPERNGFRRIVAAKFRSEAIDSPLFRTSTVPGRKNPTYV
jgi:hypothetical protein